MDTKYLWFNHLNGILVLFSFAVNLPVFCSVLYHIVFRLGIQENIIHFLIKDKNKVNLLELCIQPFLNINCHAVKIERNFIMPNFILIVIQHL